MEQFRFVYSFPFTVIKICGASAPFQTVLSILPGSKIMMFSVWQTNASFSTLSLRNCDKNEDFKLFITPLQF